MTTYPWKTVTVTALQSGTITVYSCTDTYNAPDESGQTAYCITKVEIEKGKVYIAPKPFLEMKGQEFMSTEGRTYRTWFIDGEEFPKNYPHQNDLNFLVIREKYKSLAEKLGYVAVID